MIKEIEKEKENRQIEVGYHGTCFDFDKFKPGRGQMHVDHGILAVYFSLDFDSAEEYALSSVAIQEQEGKNGKPIVYRCEIDTTGFPIVQGRDKFGQYMDTSIVGAVCRLEHRKGAPGVVFKNVKDGISYNGYDCRVIDVIAVFDLSRIKIIEKINVGQLDCPQNYLTTINGG